MHLLFLFINIYIIYQHHHKLYLFLLTNIHIICRNHHKHHVFLCINIHITYTNTTTSPPFIDIQIYRHHHSDHLYMSIQYHLKFYLFHINSIIICTAFCLLCMMITCSISCSFCMIMLLTDTNFSSIYIISFNHIYILFAS